METVRIIVAREEVEAVALKAAALAARAWAKALISFARDKCREGRRVWL